MWHKINSLRKGQCELGFIPCANLHNFFFRNLFGKEVVWGDCSAYSFFFLTMNSTQLIWTFCFWKVLCCSFSNCFGISWNRVVTVDGIYVLSDIWRSTYPLITKRGSFTFSSRSALLLFFVVRNGVSCFLRKEYCLYSVQWVMRHV